MNWDNLLQGFAGSMLGALVSIAIPLVGHYYATKVVNRTPSNAPIPPFAANISRWLGAFAVEGAKQFVIGFNETYADPNVDFSVSVGSIPRGDGFFAGSDPYVSVVVPSVVTAERHENVSVGWTRVFSHESITYRLTLTRITNKFTFQLRAIPPLATVAPSAD